MFGQAFIDTLKLVPLAVVKATSPQPNPKRCDHSEFSLSHCWMGTLTEGSKLCNLCLAGTHHSACFKLHEYVACGSCWVKCQAWDISTQLENGVRFLDLRYSKPTHFGHGPAIFARSRTVAQDILNFSQKHPSEVVVCSLRRNVNYLSPTYLKKESRDNHYDANKDLPTEETIANKVRHDPVQMFYHTLRSLQDNEQKKGFENNVQIVLVSDLKKHMHYYHQMTLGELTCRGSRGMILVYDWSIWQGSWSFTKHNQPEILLEKSKQWALLKKKNNDNEDQVDPMILIERPPRVLEYVITIDHGDTLTIAKLALTESIETVATKLDVQSHSLLNTPYLSNLDALFMDFPSASMLRSIIHWNITSCERLNAQQKDGKQISALASTPES